MGTVTDQSVTVGTTSPPTGPPEITYEVTIVTNSSENATCTIPPGGPLQCTLGGLHPDKEYEVVTQACMNTTAGVICSEGVSLTIRTLPKGKCYFL